MEGLWKIVAIRAILNRGMTDTLKVAFPEVVPIKKPLVPNPKIINLSWMAGFVSAEACFFIHIYKSETRLGMSVKLVFKITQHARDEQLMKSFIKYFDCGNIYKNEEAFEYRVEKFLDIQNKIIPFFNKNKILGVKLQDFKDWCKAAEIIKVKEHLTSQGIENLIQIKNGMNKKKNKLTTR